MNKLIRNIKPLAVRDIMLLTGLSMLLGFAFLLLFGNIISGVILTLLTTICSTYVYMVQKDLKGGIMMSQDLLSSIFNNSTDSMFLVDVETNTIQDCNDSAIDAFEISSKEQLKGKYIMDLCKEKDRIELPRVLKRLEAGETWGIETECVTFNDAHFWGSFAAKRIKISDGELDLLRISNVTKLKDAEANLSQQNANLKKANKDITKLLQEVHHRVKNNLQVITSMLRLQTGYIKDEAFREVFKNNLNRITTMSIIHEKLYHSDDLMGVNIQEYLQELARNVLDSHATGVSIRSEIDVAEVDFALDVIVPLGLLLNELITNSVKHAFGNDHEDPAITIQITNGDNYTLTYADNGKGLPEGYELEDAESFGSTLIDALIGQLDGELKVVEVSRGMCYKIRFAGEGREEIRVKV